MSSFKKLISNLPFSPSLIEELAVYGRRLQKEARLRAIGAGLVAVAILLQLTLSYTFITLLSCLIFFGLIVIFYFRSRLLAKELAIVKKNFTAGG